MKQWSIPIVEPLDYLRDHRISKKETQIKNLEKEFENKKSVDLAKKIIEEFEEYIKLPGGACLPFVEKAKESMKKYETYISEN